MHYPARLLLPLLLLVPLVSACLNDDSAATNADGEPLIYVAIGASDAVGSGARDPNSEGWVPRLHQRMPQGTRLINLGIPSLRIEQANQQVLPVALDLDPDIVTIWLTVNDLLAGVELEAYLAGLDLMLNALHSSTRARVYVANMPDLSLLPALRDRESSLHDEVLRWNAAIAQTVAANSATLVDLFEGWSELRQRPDYISRDGFHPSARGYARLAELFWQAIEQRESGSTLITPSPAANLSVTTTAGRRPAQA